MAPEPMNERIATLEAQVKRLEIDTASLTSFKESMISQLADLRADLKSLNLKIGIYVGIVVVVVNQLAAWALTQFAK